MALTPQQKKFCLQNSADRIFQALISASSTISIDDLRQFAAERREFAPKLIQIEERFASMPSPEEVRDYDNLLTIADPGDLLAAMERYIHKWSDNQAAAEHVADIRNRYLVLKEAGDYDAIRCHTLDIATRTFAEKKENISVMEEYLDDYAHDNIAPGEHVMNVQYWYDEAKDNLDREIQQMWDSLFDENHRLKSLDELENFKGIIDNYESTTYSAQIDDVAWNWAMTEDDVMSALTEYEEFSEGLSRTDKIREFRELYHEWTLVDSSDMQAVIAFAHAHPDLPFSKEVSDTICGLLNKEIEEINANPAGYDHVKFLKLYDAIDSDSKEMFRMRIGITDLSIIDRMRTLDEDRQGSIPVPQDNGLQVGPSSTDILFFGTSNSGKTCVLTSLFGHPRLHPDSAGPCGDYALSLQSYGEKQIAPPHTELGYVAMVNCDITKQSKKGKKLKMKFNLVDMAGEDLRKKICFIPVYGGELEGITKPTVFSQMDNNVKRVICNNHDKVIFIIIDPNAIHDRIQKAVIKKLLDLFELEENAGEMSKVRAIHFIVTKVDTLQGDKLEAALKIVHSVIPKADRNSLVEACCTYGINRSEDEDKNGRPRVFPFSLGRFYPGNIYAGDGTDAETIIKVIADYVVAMQGDTPGRKLRRMLTTPIIKYHH